MFTQITAVSVVTAFQAAALSLRRDAPQEVDLVGCYLEADAGVSYRGMKSTTATGRICAKWTDLPNEIKQNIPELAKDLSQEADQKVQAPSKFLQQSGDSANNGIGAH